MDKNLTFRIVCLERPQSSCKQNFILQEMEKVVQSLQSENQRLQTLFASTSSQDSCESYKSVDDEVQDVHDVRYKVVNDNNIFLLCFSSRKTFLSHTKNFFDVDDQAWETVQKMPQRGGRHSCQSYRNCIPNDGGNGQSRGNKKRKRLQIIIILLAKPLAHNTVKLAKLRKTKRNLCILVLHVFTRDNKHTTTQDGAKKMTNSSSVFLMAFKAMKY